MVEISFWVCEPGGRHLVVVAPEGKVPAMHRKSRCRSAHGTWDPVRPGCAIQPRLPSAKTAVAIAPTSGAPATQFHARDLLRNRSTRLAIACNAAGQANMSIVMVLTSLMLNHHGHSLTEIGFSHAFHSAGMFAFTIPLGRLADRHGRMQVMIPGVATTLVGAALLAFTSAWLLVTLGTFLVGLGWAGANVAALKATIEKFKSILPEYKDKILAA